ncbi:hypothetical protein THERMOT_171 [Bathymodiolus thermophilus thioautotrophic gill symbiont]|nr:hypothetical protein THERMOT_171 [Bathymodiolus thermophilus thioautotrophic gill symbiont]
MAPLLAASIRIRGATFFMTKYSNAKTGQKHICQHSNPKR